MQQKIYDIIIAGAGPAGLTAAVYARRAGKSVLLIEKEAFGGQITLSPHVENYPFTRPMSGNELVEVLVEQVMNLGADVEVGAVVEVSENADKTVTVRTDYQEFTGRTLIIATGLKHRLPGAEGEQRFIGSGISFCAVCDGAFFKDKAVAVIGGGNTAVQDAIYLSKICSKVYLIHRRSEFRAEKHVADGLAACANIEPVLNSTVARFIGEGKLSGIVVKNRETGEERELSVSGAFIAVGFAPNNGVFAELVKLDESGFIRSGEDCKTSRPEIFAAGDCRTKSVRQLVTAGADGGVAAIAACEYIDSMQNAEKAAES